MNKALVILVIVVLLGGGYYVWKQQSAGSMKPADTAAMEQTTGSSGAAMEQTTGASGTMEDSANTKSFTLDSSEFKYDLTTLTVKKGETVKITLTNSGAMMHDWVVDEFNAKTERITKGQTGTVTFVADKAGTFEFYCSVGKHRANGMVGKLIVE